MLCSVARVAAFPIGIDPERFAQALETEEVQMNIAKLLNRYAGRKVCGTHYLPTGVCSCVRHVPYCVGGTAVPLHLATAVSVFLHSSPLLLDAARNRRLV
eukprot:GHUV01056763.1.p1 GENE.GHUV01056763.1~~GHUV01056763.1.p1  ORF type:complete len:100 (-),score=14.61 GHUV01056763.1:90-389(-)